MIDQAQNSSLQTLAAGVLGFVGVVGLGSLLILHRGGSAASAPSVAYAPVDAEPGLGEPAGLKPALAGESSPAPLLPDEDREEAPVPASAPAYAPSAAAASAAAAGSPAAAAASPRLVAGRSVDMSGSASSSAALAAAEVARRTAAAPFARKPFIMPKLSLNGNQAALASAVRYGVSDRAELMGRAVGPVYNFSGKSAGGSRGGRVAADNAAAAGAIRRVKDAQKQLDSSSISADEKAKLDQNLNQIRRTPDQ